MSSSEHLLTCVFELQGLKYAHAPRFNHSFLADQSLGSKVQDVSDYGPACPQHEFTSLLAPNDIDLGAIAGYLETGLLAPVLKQSEDCLSINIQRPQGIKKSEKLPVLVWMYASIQFSLSMISILILTIMQSRRCI